MSQQNPKIRTMKEKAQGLLQARRLPEARELYQQICQLDRSDADAWFSLGLINGLMGSMEGVIASCREAIAIRPNFAEAYFNMAKALKELGRLQEAEQAYGRALDLKPQWPEAFNNLGNVLLELGKLEEARASFEQALRINSRYAEALVNLGNVLKLQGQSAQAVTNYRRALEINPNFATAYKSLGGALIILGQLDEALACYRQAGRLDPADIGMIAAEAAILERQGLADQAYATIKPYIDNGPPNLEIGNALSALCDQVGRCDEAIALLEKGLAQEHGFLQLQRRIVAHFNLGRLYDRKGEYDKAFAHFKTGNDLKPNSFDREGFAKGMEELPSVFNAEFMRDAPRATHGSQRPIFIVGMPRSGTSLVEQILSSHPQVYGAGELDDINNLSADMCKMLSSSSGYPACVRELTEDGCNRLATRYLDRLAQLSPDTRYVTDKMPQNFLHLGLIALLFPQAHIIHCMREPLDTCLSCYFHDFASYHPYVYQLENLGLYYRHYQRLMRHWREVLPLPIHDVSYEALVEDQEAVTRDMLAFCGLEWDARCLRHHENKRFVNTLSYSQVRKPIYKGAVQRWRHYEAYLEPLKQALAGEEFRD